MAYFSCLCRKDVFNSFVTTWTIAHQAPLFMRFPRQEYCSGLPFPSPGDLPDPEIKPTSPALAGWFFTTEPPENLIATMKSPALNLRKRNNDKKRGEINKKKV